MVSERLERHIGQEAVGGWELVAIDGDYRVLRRRTIGSILTHAVVAVLTIWWTFGLGNVAYAIYCLSTKTEYRVVSAADPLDSTEALAQLRQRFAAGTSTMASSIGDFRVLGRPNPNAQRWSSRNPMTRR